MWLLVFICDVRAGSFLVGDGYKAGAVSSDGTVVREEDETLRWSDYEPRRVANGEVPLLMYTKILLLPPQASELLPLQG